MAGFTSCAVSLVVNQVVFVMLTYNLLQFYLPRQGFEDLTGKPLPFAQRELLASVTNNIVYWKCYCALFTTYELVELTARASDKARKKIAKQSRRRQRELMRGLRSPRPGWTRVAAPLGYRSRAACHRPLIKGSDTAAVYPARPWIRPTQLHMRPAAA